MIEFIDVKFVAGYVLHPEHLTSIVINTKVIYISGNIYVTAIISDLYYHLG